MLVVSAKELPAALEVVAREHHYDEGGLRCTVFEGGKRCRRKCSRVAVATTCYIHTDAEEIVLRYRDKKSASWIATELYYAKDIGPYGNPDVQRMLKRDLKAFYLREDAEEEAKRAKKREDAERSNA